MGWSRYAVAGFLVVFIFVTGLFGQHFGYTVDGMPKGEGAVKSSAITIDLPWMDDSETHYMFSEDEEGNVISRAMEYIWDMTRFKIDGMPDAFSGIFIFIILLALLLIFSCIRGGGD